MTPETSCIKGKMTVSVTTVWMFVHFGLVWLNPLHANLNFVRKRPVPKFIQNGGVRLSLDITAATFCAFFKLGCR